ncbi:MAG: hypothetical protein LC799_19470, partial [Actinobacteria bacterium]|nr:hypothetical protein [Actinomycetota bacterium]
TDPPDDHQDISNPMITWGPCFYLQRHADIIICRTLFTWSCPWCKDSPWLTGSVRPPSDEGKTPCRRCCWSG